MLKKNILVVFGGRSVEHEISIITACQAIKNFNKEKYNIVPVYISKKGFWYTGNKLVDVESYKDNDVTRLNGIYRCRLVGQMNDNKFYLEVDFLFLKKRIEFDLAFPLIHGTNGEDGTIQGLFEMLNVPYVGSGVFSSAIGMDKVAQKILFKENGIDVVPFDFFWLYDWKKNKNQVLNKIKKKLRFPFCVKPANLGSSVGISIAKNEKELINSVDVAGNFDRKIIVEEALIDMKEINCAVLGFEDDVLVSVCEQPLKTEEILSYKDKYIKDNKTKGLKSLSRIIPAKIPDNLRIKVQNWAIEAFKSIGACGVSRIDFMYDNKTKKLFLNEINTLPGSLSFYLWESSGLSYQKLLDKLVDIGLERYNLRNNLLVTYNANIFGSKG